MSELIYNIAGYQFALLSELKDLRMHLLDWCKKNHLKGTILLSAEGINLFLAGSKNSIELFLAEVRKLAGLESFQVKYSESDYQPFTRMLVKIKKEIISFGIDEVNPAKYTSPRMTATTLKQWLDEGKPVTLLDTRNDYEVKLGTFRNAVPIGINHFRDFPDAVKNLPEELKNQSIVTFCTGGIRCEKAAPYLELQGFENIFQLEGGILKYFEEAGGDHYDGECFVFDHRVGLDPSLRETPSAVCFQCQAPLDKRDQVDHRYIENQSCPYCYKDDIEKMNDLLERRNHALKSIVCPLPGSEPYENRRPISIKKNYDGWRLIDFICEVFPHIERDEWLSRFAAKRFVDKNEQNVNPDYLVKSGERFDQIMPHSAEPDVNMDIKIIYEDEALIVVKKPAPLPMHPCGRFNKNTLQFLMNKVYFSHVPRPVHRLDANTTGLVMFARTQNFCKIMQRQFLEKSIEKIYLARVQGNPKLDLFVCEKALSATPSIAGSREIDEENGLPSRTDFKVIHRYDDDTTLLEVKLHSGRTNQIRLHLWDLGLPVCGDQTYLKDQKMGNSQTLEIDSPAMFLHAWKISCNHPVTNKVFNIEDTCPAWAEK
jgi:UPF0176 protein